MKISTFCFLLLLATNFARSEVRTWTNTQGVAIKAECVECDATTATLKLTTGKLAKVPLDKLCPADQEFLQNNPPTSDTTATGTATGKEADATAAGVSDDDVIIPDKWPDVVEGPKDVKLKNLPKSKASKEGFGYQSRHYKFQTETELADDAQEAIGRLFETTFTAVCAMPLPFPRTRRQTGVYDASLYKSMASYLANGGPASSAGVFKYKSDARGNVFDDIVMVPYPSMGVATDGTMSSNTKIDSHVLSHELTHQLTAGVFKGATWANEGFADYVGYMPYDGKQFHFSKGLNNITAKAKSRGAHNLSYSFEELLTMPQEEFYNKGSGPQNYLMGTLAVAFFFHLDGKNGIKNFIDYMKALRNARPGKPPVKELLGKRTLQQMETDFCAAWKERGVEIVFQPPTNDKSKKAKDKK